MEKYDERKRKQKFNFRSSKRKMCVSCRRNKSVWEKIAVTSLNKGRAAFIPIIQTCNSFKFPIEIKCNMPSINNHKNQ